MAALCDERWPPVLRHVVKEDKGLHPATAAVVMPVSADIVGRVDCRPYVHQMGTVIPHLVEGARVGQKGQKASENKPS